MWVSRFCSTAQTGVHRLDVFFGHRRPKGSDSLITSGRVDNQDLMLVRH